MERMFAHHQGESGERGVEDERLAQLSDQERRILPLIAEGKTNREIADAVHLSVEGVKGQLRTLSERFGVADLPQNRKRLELAQRALRAGLGAPARE